MSNYMNHPIEILKRKNYFGILTQQLETIGQYSTILCNSTVHANQYPVPNSNKIKCDNEPDLIVSHLEISYSLFCSNKADNPQVIAVLNFDAKIQYPNFLWRFI